MSNASLESPKNATRAGYAEATNGPAMHETPGNGATSTCDFSIVIVTYNVREFLRQALLSLHKALLNLSAEVFVVDNASDDGSAEMVRAQFPSCRLIVNSENLGFAAGNNLALRQSRGRYLVLLNPDTIVQEDTFTAIREFMHAHPRTGMVGCKVLNPDGTLQLACRRSFPTPWVAFTKLMGLSNLFPRSRWFGRYNLTYLPEDKTCEVEAISGSFMVVRREAVEQVGYLDEDFFLYGEDLDWCMRVLSAGWLIHYYPGTQIVHFKGESSRRSNLDTLRLFYQAMGLFVRKHFRRRMFIFSYWLLHLAIWTRAAIALSKSVLDKIAVPLADFVLMQIDLGIAIWLRFESSAVLHSYVVVDLIYSSVWLSCLAMFGCYRESKFSSYRAFVAASTGFLLNASFTYFFNQYAFSRQVVLIAGGLNILLLAAWRLAVKARHFLSTGKIEDAFGRTMLGHRTLVVGDFETDGALVERLRNNVAGKYDLVGLVSLDPNQIGRLYSSVPVIASLHRLDDYLRSTAGNRIQQVIFSTQRVPFDHIIGVMSRQRRQRITFKLVPSEMDVIIGKSSIDQIVEVPLVEIENRLLRFWPAAAKRLLDIVLAFIALIFLAPFFLLRMLMIRRFEATEIKLEISSFRVWSLRGNGRVGRWPWLLAILLGRLSWVGREISIADGESLSPATMGLQPGITGLPQVNRGAPLSQEEKQKYYLYYVTHYSPLLDLEILFRAIFRI